MDFFRRQHSLYGVPAPIRRAMEAAERYKSRDPFEIIERRRIKLHMTCRFTDLLGYFIIKSKVQHIGVNANVPYALQRTVAAHELGHALLHFLEVMQRGSLQDDTMLYSIAGGKMENEANLFAGELLLADEDILTPCHYDSYCETKEEIREQAAHYRTKRDKQLFEEETWRDFFMEHPDLPSYDELDHEHGVDVHLVEFKFLSLQYKGYDMPNIPETKKDFLRRG